MTASLPPILLLGGGKMGGAMLAGWVELGLAPSVVIDPAPGAVALSGGTVTVVASVAAVPPGFRPEAVVLAVKPQSADDAVPPAIPLFGEAVVLSIMAGKTVASLHRLAGERPVVRAMPNTPAAIRQGITVGFAAAGVSAAQRTLCDRLLSAIGAVDWVEDEALIDPVTAVSGSGPAYVFLLAELMETAAIEQGIPAPLARRLARLTVSGSGALLAASDQDAADLRIAVTSPGGTTQRALAVLLDSWPGVMSRAIEAATQRSRELGSV